MTHSLKPKELDGVSKRMPSKNMKPMLVQFVLGKVENYPIFNIVLPRLTTSAPGLRLQPNPPQNHTGHRLHRPFELHVRQRLMIIEDVDLVVEVGVVLGRGPDHVEQA